MKRDRGSGALIIFTVFVSIILALSLGYAGVGPLPDWIFYPGIFLMLLGVDCPGGGGSPGYRQGSVPAGPTPLVHWSLDHVHRIIASSTILRSTAGSAGRLRRVLRLPDESRRKNTTVRTRRRLRELHETHETAHTLHHLVALKVRRDLLTVPSIRLELEDGSELVTCTLQM